MYWFKISKLGMLARLQAIQNSDEKITVFASEIFLEIYLLFFVYMKYVKLIT